MLCIDNLAGIKVYAVDVSYACYLFQPRTIPFENRCLPCSDEQYGCRNPNIGLIDKDLGELCDFFCPRTQTTNKNQQVQHNQQDKTNLHLKVSSNPIDNGSQSRKILIIFALIFSLVVLFVFFKCYYRVFNTPMNRNTAWNEYKDLVLQYY